MYRLTRDDGVELQMNGDLWESALELACLYGWTPAGTKTAQAARRRTMPSVMSKALNLSRDYFSVESQHVERGDARQLADAVLRALGHIPDGSAGATTGSAVAVATATPVVPAASSTPRALGTAPAANSGQGPSPIPSRASVFADGLTGHRRKVMSRFADFAGRGGFTIGPGNE